jgi:uncharacterized protein YkwD
MVAALVATVAAGAVSHQTSRSRSAEVLTVRRALDGQIFGAMNAARVAHGLPRLRSSGQLEAAAQAHSREMLVHGFFAHQSFGGGTFWRRIARYYPSTGYRRWFVGETLVWVSPDVDARTAVQDWLNSPEHRVILLGSTWRDVGLSALHVAAAPGAFAGREVTIVTADFGVRAR